MKSILVLAVVAFASLSQAQVSSGNITACNSWSYSSAAGGYVCMGYPMSMQVPDVYSLNSKIANLEARIRQLEAKQIESRNAQELK